MNEPWLAPAVPQVVVLEEFDRDPTLPIDDTPLFTVLVTLVALLVVYGAILLSSLHRSACDLPKAETLISTRAP